MNTATAPKAIVKRPRNTVPIAPQASKEAKKLAAVILEVLAGMRTMPQAAEALRSIVADDAFDPDIRSEAAARLAEVGG